MKLTIPQDALMAAITRTAKAVAAKSALPVLANLHLDAADGRLNITATNLHLGIRSTVPCQVIEPGATTVDAKLFADFVAGLDRDRVCEIATEGKLGRQLSVVAGPAKASINTVGADDFPAIPDGEGEAVTVDAAELARIIRATERHAATDDSRPPLAGILIQRTDRGIRAACADGFSLAVIEAADWPWLDGSLLIPAINARHIATIATELGGEVEVLLNRTGGLILFRFESVTVWSSLIEAVFPDVVQIVPRQHSYRVEIEAARLVSAIKRAQTFARDNNNVIRLTFRAGEQEFDPHTLDVSGSAKERGNGDTELKVVVSAPSHDPDAGPVQVPPLALDARYALNAIASLGAERIAIGINGSQQAVTFRPAGDDSHVVVVMPMVIGAY